jgi:hypothetical protein
MNQDQKSKLDAISYNKQFGKNQNSINIFNFCPTRISRSERTRLRQSLIGPNPESSFRTSILVSRSAGRKKKFIVKSPKAPSRKKKPLQQVPIQTTNSSQHNRRSLFNHIPLFNMRTSYISRALRTSSTLQALPISATSSNAARVASITRQIQAPIRSQYVSNNARYFSSRPALYAPATENTTSSDSAAPAGEASSSSAEATEDPVKKELEATKKEVIDLKVSKVFRAHCL